MTDVQVPFGDRKQTATLLLAAAEDLGLPASVVRMGRSGFTVPEEVAQQATAPEPAKKVAAKKEVAKKAPAKKAAKKVAKKAPAEVGTHG